MLGCVGRGTPYKGKGEHICLVVHAVEPLYRGHHWDPAGCPVYSGTSLWRTPLGPSWLSCIEVSLIQR